MVLSKREKIILIATLITVGLLIGDRWVFTPVVNKLQALETERTDLRAKLNDVDLLFKKQKSLEAKWKLLEEEMPNGAQAESKGLEMLNQWSQTCKLKVSSIRPERVAGDKELQEMVFAFGGTGTLSAVASFLWEIETSPLPFKITSITLGSSGDSGEQMSLTLSVSAVYPGTGPKNRQLNQPGANGNENGTL